MKYIYFPILIFICFPKLCLSQDIYLLGELKQNNIPTIIKIVQTVNDKYMVKELPVFNNNLNGSPLKYKRKDPNNNSKIKSQLSDIIKSQEHINSPLSDLIDDYSRNIVLKYKNKRKLIVFDIAGTDQFPAFNDLDKLIFYIKNLDTKKEKIVFLIVLQSIDPELIIDNPKNGKVINSNSLIIDGTIHQPLYVKQPKFEVFLRLNNGSWKRAVIDSKSSEDAQWSYEFDIDENIKKNVLEVFAINSNFDTSEIQTVKGLVYKNKEITTLQITPLSPQKFEVADKCNHGYNAHFYFKFSILDPDIDLGNVEIVFENAQHNVIMNKSIESLLKNDETCLRTLRVSESRTDYCLFVIFSDLKFESPCAIDDSLKYYYYFKYNVAAKQPLTTDKVMIHFPSFDQTKEKDCDCN